ncbi:MAG: hypothetical protein DRG78_19825 [Epsilonproteobacteria bacterium]|nr:MAG: hypothetical protein DRG78_19825 [Campylobacterota bacterium]
MNKNQNLIKGLLLFGLLSIQTIINANDVKICDDESEWLPYTYFEREDGKIDKTKLTGATVDLVDDIFKIVDLKYSIDMIPWTRCTKLVEHFDKSHKYEVFLDGTYSTERAEKYYITTPIYTIDTGIFYSTKIHPNGITINKQSDINNYTICDVNGYNIENLYKIYGLKKEIKVDTTATTLSDVLQKIMAGRCDIVLNSIEPTMGTITLSKGKLDNLKYVVMPNTKSKTFHIFISKKSPRAYELLTKINQAILILQNNGVSKKIFKKYISND